MYVTHHAHKYPPPGYRSTASNTSSDQDATPTPWPTPGFVHIFPDIPICDIPASYTAGKEWTYVAGEGWFERGTYQFPQSQPKAAPKLSCTIRRQISYYRLARSILIFFIIGPLLLFFGLKATVGLLLYGWRRWIL